MAQKKVRMLSALAGMNYSHQVGDVISVKAEIAKAWIEGGIAEVAPNEASAKAEAKKQAERARTLAEENKGLRETVARLETRIEALEADKADLAKKAGQSELPLAGNNEAKE